ncbi:MAG: hypothetical protein KDB27_09190 [Planctomycetales bacterium]|nr:hypothetical protein [Planctomycetales bacterium]
MNAKGAYTITADVIISDDINPDEFHLVAIHLTFDGAIAARRATPSPTL